MMMFILNSLIRLRSDESGQGLVEYLLILALVAFAATAGMGSLASGLNSARRSVAYWAFTSPSTRLTKVLFASGLRKRRAEANRTTSLRYRSGCGSKDGNRGLRGQIPSDLCLCGGYRGSRDRCSEPTDSKPADTERHGRCLSHAGFAGWLAWAEEWAARHFRCERHIFIDFLDEMSY